jgi:4a-hydroxytetrahydrobiopterin dehydratase
MRKLSEKEIREKLKPLTHWSYEGNCLVRFFRLKDFSTAVKFINEILPIAESLYHHPDIEIKNYNEVIIRLTTHDVGGVTQLDFDLAQKIEELIKNYST